MRQSNQQLERYLVKKRQNAGLANNADLVPGTDRIECIATAKRITRRQLLKQSQKYLSYCACLTLKARSVIKYR
jgi:hypothetical protein